MDNNKNGLIKYKENNIFKKIFSFIKGFFSKKNNYESINETNVVIDNQESDNYNIDNNIISDNINADTIKKERDISNKEEFFKLYNDYCDGKIKSKDISLYELAVINRILSEEMNIYGYYDDENREWQ